MWLIQVNYKRRLLPFIHWQSCFYWILYILLWTQRKSGAFSSQDLTFVRRIIASEKLDQTPNDEGLRLSLNTRLETISVNYQCATISTHTNQRVVYATRWSETYCYTALQSKSKQIPPFGFTRPPSGSSVGLPLKCLVTTPSYGWMP